MNVFFRIAPECFRYTDSVRYSTKVVIQIVFFGIFITFDFMGIPVLFEIRKTFEISSSMDCRMRIRYSAV